MSNLAFDTHARVEQLVKTGVTEARAEAFDDIVAGATVRPDVSQLATKSDLATLASELRGEISGVRGEMKRLAGELIWWIVGCFGLNAGIGLSVAPQLLAHLPK